MKKMLIMGLLMIGGVYFVKNEVTITQDNQVRVAGWQVPIPPAVQASPVYGMVTMLVKMQTAPAATAAPAAAPARPAMPSVSSAVSTYNPNPPPPAKAASAASPANVADQFNTASKALRGQ